MVGEKEVREFSKLDCIGEKSLLSGTFGGKKKGMALVVNWEGRNWRTFFCEFFFLSSCFCFYNDNVGDHIRGATVTTFDGDVQVLVLSRLKWVELHTSGVIKDSDSELVKRSARTMSSRYSKVDAARIQELMKNGEAISEGVNESI